MIELYTWATPNGWKVSAALEEMGMNYSVHPIDINTNIQKEPDFLYCAIILFWKVHLKLKSTCLVCERVGVST